MRAFYWFKKGKTDRYTRASGKRLLKHDPLGDPRQQATADRLCSAQHQQRHVRRHKAHMLRRIRRAESMHHVEHHQHAEHEQDEIGDHQSGCANQL